ncbi:hypothetical protein BIWAKO_01853 [Bosea sp. BIWAKO-01]|nr:hypothetical protein BIWAKO_01853 [Bosea sp. BIWAKO-01]
MLAPEQRLRGRRNGPRHCRTRAGGARALSQPATAKAALASGA